MEYCSGGEFLRMLLHQPGYRLHEEHAKFYASELLLAVEYLHIMGFIHRDLKPENILLHQSGHIRLADFGLSKRYATQSTIVKSFWTNRQPEIVEHQGVVIKSKSFVGSEYYVAPEIITGSGQSSTVDWWTYGVLIYIMMFGRPPFRGKTSKETINKIMSGEFTFPDNIEVTNLAKDLIKKLLTLDYKKRLGYKNGAATIKKHPWFKDIKWALIANSKPPIVPKLSNPSDTSNFDYADVVDDVPDEIISPDPKDPFHRFTFRHKKRQSWMLYWYELDPSGQTIPEGRAHHTTVNIGERLFLFGGRQGNTFYNSIYIFDAETSTWSKPAATGIEPPGMFGHTCSLLENKLYIFGGCDGKRHLNDLFILDIETMEWSKPEFDYKPPPRDYHTATFIDKLLYIFGGWDGVHTYNDVHVLDTEKMKWSSPQIHGQAPTPRTSHRCFSVQNKIIFFWWI